MSWKRKAPNLRVEHAVFSSYSRTRFLGGIGIGISTVAAPLYISEIAPPAFRGRLAGLFQFNIVFGCVLALVSNVVIAQVGGVNAWRWMLGIAAFPSVLYAAMCFGLPESPRWLLSRKGDRAAGLRVLQLIWVKTMVPETKGISLEDMQRKLHIGESTPGIPV